MRIFLIRSFTPPGKRDLQVVQVVLGNLDLKIGGVSDETVIYGYMSCVTLTSEWLHRKL
jgi:hypothetical protein